MQLWLSLDAALTPAVCTTQRQPSHPSIIEGQRFVGNESSHQLLSSLAADLNKRRSSTSSYFSPIPNYQNAASYVITYLCALSQCLSLSTSTSLVYNLFAIKSLKSSLIFLSVSTISKNPGNIDLLGCRRSEIDLILDRRSAVAVRLFRNPHLLFPIHLHIVFSTFYFIIYVLFSS